MMGSTGNIRYAIPSRALWVVQLDSQAESHWLSFSHGREIRRKKFNFSHYFYSFSCACVLRKNKCKNIFAVFYIWLLLCRYKASNGAERVWKRLRGKTSDSGSISLEKKYSNLTVQEDECIFASGLMVELDMLIQKEGKGTQDKHLHFQFTVL